ncbi:hypothetical protein MUN88_08910 [Gracilibacillus caseinilyticus]|uniref:Uncharacterized protein n=1 Tax=Gracilibacillus caseinilyticus TaxID=2932256 RepID=A0ABY4F6T2_9BACI|nr:hypothetical protein [Gracilibacillus caseinilyticus]UOQ50156.1 hypothetical protein MUN88_08910 [Gracilibacillus caseinilyticus]
MIKNFFIQIIGWFIGVFAAILIISVLKNEEVDWNLFISMCIGGVIGTFIALGIQKAYKSKKYCK